MHAMTPAAEAETTRHNHGKSGFLMLTLGVISVFFWRYRRRAALCLWHGSEIIAAKAHRDSLPLGDLIASPTSSTSRRAEGLSWDRKSPSSSAVAPSIRII